MYELFPEVEMKTKEVTPSTESRQSERQEPSHTPTPWAVWEPPYEGPRTVIVRGDGASLASIESGDPHLSDAENEANARFIVRAVNNHERYKAALEAITRIAGNLTDEAVEAVGGVNDARSRALMVVVARQIANKALTESDGQ